MRAKSLVLLVVALGCGMVAAVAVSKAVMDQGDGPPAEATVEIFVAVKEIPNGCQVSPDAIKLERWPQSRLPEGAIGKVELITGKFTKQGIFPGEPILEKKLNDTRDSFSTGLRAGFRTFDLSSNGIGYIKPGDHVDVIGTFKLEGNGNVAEARTVLRNVEVYAINGVTTRESDGKQTSGQGTFQLQVKESQIEALMLANKLGELRVSLRPFGEGLANDPEAQSDNGESFVNWVQENEKDPPVGTKPKHSAPLQPTANGQTALNTPSTEKNEMLIVTPMGVTRYQWSGPNGMPKLVKEDEQGVNNQNTSPAPANWPYAAGNVYSGFGGYAPNYPAGAANVQQPMPGANLGQGVPPTDASILNATEGQKVD